MIGASKMTVSKEAKNKNNRAIKILVAVAVAVVAIVAGIFLKSQITDKKATSYSEVKHDNEVINAAADKVTGVDYKVESGVVVYDGDADKEAEVVQYAEAEEGELIAHIQIKDYGTITVKFFSEQAPLAVDNFVTHVREGYYDGLSFHRIMDDFMIQGGDPEGTGLGGVSIWEKDGEDVPFEDEYSKYLMPIRGALCMANAGASTNGSQFFIVQKEEYRIEDVMTIRGKEVDNSLIKYYKENGGAGWLYGAHTVFGQVIDGYDVLDKVAGVEVNSSSKPLNDVIIEKIELDIY